MNAYRRRFTPREAWAAVAVAGVGLLALMPILIHELDEGNQSGVAAAARLTLSNVVQVIATLFAVASVGTA